MTRLIDADAFKKENERLLHCDFPYLSETTLEELIDEAPTIDAEPVRHGKWIEYSFPAHECIYCSECKEEYAPEALWDLDGNSLPKYCPHCGARMDEE